METKKEINRLQLGLSAGSHFIVDIYQSFYVGLIPILVLKFDLSLFQVSLLGATSFIANSLFSPGFGYLSDKYGLRKFLAFGPLVTSVLLSLVGVAPYYWLVLVFLFFGNLGIASYHPASAAIAGHYGGNKKGFSTSLINFGGNFGSALGSLLVILILQKIGMAYTPLAMIPGIIVFLILLRFVPSDEHKIHILDQKKSYADNQNFNSKKIFMISSLVFTVYSLYILWISLTNYMPVYFTDAGLPLINIGIALFFFGALGGAGGFISGFLKDKYKRGSYVIQVGLFISIPLIYLIFEFNVFLGIVFFVLGGLFLIPIQPVCIRMAQDLFPSNMSLASSLILGLSSGLAAATIIFLGKAADIIGIVNLIRLELILLALSFMILFFYPAAERKWLSAKPGFVENIQKD
ncbi:MAG: MFS transporter [Actinomycetota bacterium]